MTSFTQIWKCSTDTIMHHPDSESAGQIHLETMQSSFPSILAILQDYLHAELNEDFTVFGQIRVKRECSFDCLCTTQNYFCCCSLVFNISYQLHNRAILNMLLEVNDWLVIYRLSCIFIFSLKCTACDQFRIYVNRNEEVFSTKITHQFNQDTPLNGVITIF